MIVVTLLLQGVKNQQNGQNLASIGDQVPKSNVTLLLQGIKCQNQM